TDVARAIVSISGEEDLAFGPHFLGGELVFHEEFAGEVQHAVRAEREGLKLRWLLGRHAGEVGEFAGRGGTFARGGLGIFERFSYENKSRGGLGSLFELNLVSQALQAVNQMIRDRFVPELVEPLGTQIAVVLLGVADQVMANLKD